MKQKLVLTVLALAFLFGAYEASAKNDHASGRGNKKDKAAVTKNYNKHDNGKHDNRGDRVFTSDVRAVINTFYEKQLPSKYRAGTRGCPPGLAKKNPLCMPPGQYKKLVIGQPLPHDVRYYPLPGELLGRLPRAPHNAYYGVAGNDVVLMSSVTNVVLEVIDLMSR